MRSSAQVVTLWGSQAPTHSITAILITEDQRTIVTGSQEGQLCLWTLSPELQISPKQILLGHSASVTCLAKARDFEKQPYVVSAAEDGEMCLWSVACGQCVEHTTLPFRHTAICYYHSSFRMMGDGWLLCCGQYNDVLVVDAGTLALLHRLESSRASDWVRCMCLVHSPRIQEDSLIAVSVAGDLKVWDLSSSVSRIQEKEGVHEREARPLGCAPCLALRFCSYTGRLLLVVFSSCWKVYDYCDFSLLGTESSPRGQSFAGGDILAAHRLIVWTEDGRGFIYQLPNSGLSRGIQPSSGRALRETVHPPLLLCLTDVEENESFSHMMGFLNERKEPFYKILYSGDASGRITLWHIPDVPVSTLDGSPREIPTAASSTLQDHFGAHSSLAPSLLGPLWGADVGDGSATIWSSVYIPSCDRLVCGCEDGQILVVLVLPTAKARLLAGGSSPGDALPHGVLRGHSSSVTALLYLHGQSTRFDRSWLVSGSQDSCVIWWDLFTGEILHQFSLQAGPITDLLLSSENYRFQSQRVVCCLCGDHSVALLHLQERSCLLHARSHPFPVETLRWRPLEDLLVVGCEDGSAYIWDVETGTLERHETGERAKAVLACCEDSSADSLLPALEGDLRQRRTLGSQSSSSHKVAAQTYSSPTHREKASRCKTTVPCAFPLQPAAVCHAQRPFALLPVKTRRGCFHVLFFDPARLAEVLHSSPLNGLKPSSSCHSSSTLKRAKSTAEKRTLVLKRSRTSGSLSPWNGQVAAAGGEQAFGAGSLEPGAAGIKRLKKPKSSKKIRRQPSGKVNVDFATDTAKLLLSCLLPWGVDRESDSLYTRHFDILPLLQPVSFGLVSKEKHLSLWLPGWSQANPAGAEQQHERVNLFSSKVLDLRTKYLSVAQEHAGKTHRCTKDLSAAEESSALVYLLNRICFVQRIISTPLEKASPQERESVRPKGRASQSSGTSTSYEEPSEHVLRFPVHDLEIISLVKLISSWRTQSIEVMEAIQAALLAEVQWSTSHLQKTLVNSHRQELAPAASAGGEIPKTDQPAMTKSPPLLSLAGSATCNGASSPAGFSGGDDSAERRVSEELEGPDEKKPHPWMSKVCSCKVC
ncbi:WD repeat-containing protein 72 isoform X2 [Hemicordylus capensis]|uniref:WD repeat-containing protein 72 isoform X2 n=2 Tax=Hemicordylus capensis TaxID=884348 RepID=UPI0023030144|nr:WD repeat-containing protein 72 isoform X2 [Hemicordylus capensis]